MITVPSDFDKLGDWGKEVKDATGERADGMRIYVTGDLGFNADSEEVFSSIDTKLLLATVLLVLVLLGAIYRSPVIALIPLVVVGLAYTIAQGLIYLYADSGATVSVNSTSIIVVLMFGVGTDYCLLLVSRYREELRTHEDKHEAMQRAVQRAGPAILASGLTVTLAMLVLLVADVGSRPHARARGGDRRVLRAAGRPHAAARPAHDLRPPGLLAAPAAGRLRSRGRADAAKRGLWRRFGDRVLHRPGRRAGA